MVVVVSVVVSVAVSVVVAVDEISVQSLIQHQQHVVLSHQK